MTVKQTKTYCRVCISACGLVVDVDGEEVLQVRGDPDHPVTQGYSCTKGRALPGLHHHPRRLTRPQIRADGTVTDVSWERVLDDLGGKLRRIIDESGPRAVGIFLGGGGYGDAAGYLAVRNAPTALGTPSYYSDSTIDAIAKVWVSEMMCGIAGQMPQPDYDRVRMVLYIGHNPSVSHGHATMLPVPAESLRRLTRQGEVWVMDPRRTETANRSTRHLSPRPGSDYAVLAYLVREILREGADTDYLDAHAQDVDRLAAAVEPYDIARAAGVSGLSTAELQELLQAVRRAGRLAVETGTGVTMASEGNVIVWLAWSLMIVTGSMDREGGAWVNPGLLAGMDRRDFPPAPAGGTRGPGPASRTDLGSICGEYPCAAIPDEIEAGNLRAMLCVGGHMVACLPETGRTVAALGKLEVFATIDVIGNATTDIATHVLPAKDQLERADCSAIVDFAYPRPAAQYAGPAVAPVGDVRSAWWILTQIGKRLGVEFIPGVDPDTATDQDLLALITEGTPVSLSQLREEGIHVPKGNLPIGWLQRYVDRHLGGWRLAPRELVDQLDTMEPPAPLVLLSRRLRRHINGKLTDMETQKGILLNAREAARAGLLNGARAVVRTRTGHVEGVVRIDDSLPDGVLNVPHGWEDEFNANRLTSTRDVDRYTGMARFSGFPVAIEPA